MKTLFLSLLGAAALSVAPSIARADDTPGGGGAPPPPPTGRFFETFDKNADGKVTREEFQGDAEVFRLLDKDGDGVVTLAEVGLPADFKPRPPDQRRADEGGMPGGRGPGKGGGGGMRDFLKKLQEMDKDGDKRVSRAEYTGPAEGFDRMDRNKDGFLDEKDRAMAGKEGGKRMLEQVRARLKEMDKDGDGRVSKAEYTGEMPFDTRDVNKDGFLDEEDIKAYEKRMDDRGPGGPGAPPGAKPPPGEGGMPGMDGEPGGDMPGDGHRPPPPGLPGDGTPGERPGGERGDFAEKRFAQLDKDGDGKLSSAELPRPEMLKDADKDGDGSLSKQEYKDALMRHRAGGGKPGGDAPGGGAQGKGAHGLTSEALKRFDANQDGKVGRDEFPGSDERFKKCDANGDGVLTADDLPKEPSAPAAPKAP